MRFLPKKCTGLFRVIYSSAFISPTGKGTVSRVEFRACLESFFGGGISDSAFDDLIQNVTTTAEGKIQRFKDSRI